MPESTKEMQETHEDEIDLRDYINVIIKRKKVIFTVFSVAVITTIIFSFLTPKVYEVSMIIEPPIMSVTNTGVQNLDSVENIRAKIEEGAFNTKIIKGLDIKVRSLQFNISQPSGTRLIKVSLVEAAEKTDLGIQILNKLLEALSLNYTKFIEDKKGEIDNQIAMVSGQTSRKEKEIKLKEEQLRILEERYQRLFDEIKEIKSNTERLIHKREALLAGKDTKDDVTSLLYTITLQQNISYFNQLQRELSNSAIDRENVLTVINNLTNNIDENQINIRNLEIAKNDMHNIILIQEPLVSLKAIGPNKRRNVAIAGVFSLMIGVFLVFLIEYWQKSK